MKAALNIVRLILLILSINLITSCKKDKPRPPDITTTAVTEISYTIATSGGNLIDEGSSSVLSMGICWNTSPNPSIENIKTSENVASGIFVSNATQLTQNTKYYLKAYATNSAGTSYGNEVTFTTIAVSAPLLTTEPVTSITGNSAISGGNITADNGGLVTERGICWSTTINPTISDSRTTDGTGNGTYISNITGLSEATLYHIRSYATNSSGTAYGEDVTFTTLAKPILTKADLSGVTTSSVIIDDNISSDGGSPVIERGVCWSNSQTPTINDNKTTNGSGSGVFQVSVSGLMSNTSYYMRAYATNALGISYSNELKFKTFAVIDIDGNGYHSVTFGDQVWLTENLVTSKYSNGDLISTTSPTTLNISSEDTPKYQWPYYLDSNLTSTYGRYYTWYAATDDRNICPAGWHLPTPNEFSSMEVYLDTHGFDFEGNTSYVAKSIASTSRWREYSMPGTPGFDQITNNKSGFTATPGGYRIFDYTFGSETMMSAFWTSFSKDDQDAFFQEIGNNYVNLFLTYGNKKNGIPVRCVKD